MPVGVTRLDVLLPNADRSEATQDNTAEVKDPEVETKEPEASTSEVKLGAEVKEDKKSTKKSKTKGKNKETVSSVDPRITEPSLTLQPDISTLVDATADLTLAPTSDQPPSTVPAPLSAAASSEQPARRPPTAPRQSRDLRSDDPKVTPRAGNFWTHDQRYDQQGEGFGGRGSWRGRGFDRGSFRGGFRGRGRGGFVPPFAPGRGGAQAGTGRGRELTDNLEQKNADGDEKTLEMDKLEAALEKQKEAAQKEADPSGTGDEVAAEVEQAPAEVKTRPTKESKWGHEGFESMQAVMHFQANRMLRGRGRGRGFFGKWKSNAHRIFADGPRCRSRWIRPPATIPRPPDAEQNARDRRSKTTLHDKRPEPTVSPQRPCPRRLHRGDFFHGTDLGGFARLGSCHGQVAGIRSRSCLYPARGEGEPRGAIQLDLSTVLLFPACCVFHVYPSKCASLCPAQTDAPACDPCSVLGWDRFAPALPGQWQ